MPLYIQNQNQNTFYFYPCSGKYQQHFSVQLKLLPILVRQAKTTDLDDENRCSQCHDTAPTRSIAVMPVKQLYFERIVSHSHVHIVLRHKSHVPSFRQNVLVSRNLND